MTRPPVLKDSNVLAEDAPARGQFYVADVYEGLQPMVKRGTVKYLREEYNAKFFVMSATLPAILKDRLAEVLGDYSMLQASSDLYTEFQRHKLVLKDGELLDSKILDQIAEVSLGGESVMVCCNTVMRAQQAYRKLRSILGADFDIVLLHEPDVFQHGLFRNNMPCIFIMFVPVHSFNSNGFAVYHQLTVFDLRRAESYI